MTIVTTKDMRKAGYCVNGSKVFFDRYGLNWRKFIKEGLPAEQFENTKDAMALKVVEIARGRK